MESKFWYSRWIFKTKSSCHLRSTVSSCWTNASCIQLCPLLLPLTSCPSGGLSGNTQLCGKSPEQWMIGVTLLNWEKKKVIRCSVCPRCSVWPVWAKSCWNTHCQGVGDLRLDSWPQCWPLWEPGRTSHPWASFSLPAEWAVETRPLIA